MTAFLAGLIIGAAVALAYAEYNKVKSRIIQGTCDMEKGEEHMQWNNIMNYDGTGRRQYTGED